LRGRLASRLLHEVERARQPPTSPATTAPCADAPIAGQTVRSASFADRFNASLLAIKRDDKNVRWSGGQLNDETLEVGGCVGGGGAGGAEVCDKWLVGGEGRAL
jgi:hypothetical protein